MNNETEIEPSNVEVVRTIVGETEEGFFTMRIEFETAECSELNRYLAPSYQS